MTIDPANGANVSSPVILCCDGCPCCDLSQRIPFAECGDESYEAAPSPVIVATAAPATASPVLNEDCSKSKIALRKKRRKEERLEKERLEKERLGK